MHTSTSFSEIPQTHEKSQFMYKSLPLPGNSYVSMTSGELFNHSEACGCLCRWICGIRSRESDSTRQIFILSLTKGQRSAWGNRSWKESKLHGYASRILYLYPQRCDILGRQLCLDLNNFTLLTTFQPWAFLDVAGFTLVRNKSDLNDLHQRVVLSNSLIKASSSGNLTIPCVTNCWGLSFMFPMLQYLGIRPWDRKPECLSQEVSLREASNWHWLKRLESGCKYQLLMLSASGRLMASC